MTEIRRLARQAARSLGANEEDAWALELASEEAATNIVEHAYAGRGGRIQVDVSREGNELVIVFRDWGAPFDPARVPAPPLTKPLEERTPGGLGLYIMRYLMSKVEFEFDGANGNRLEMRRKLVGSG